jgi:orotate phosphoribosyltransferase
VTARYRMPVISVATLDDLVAYLHHDARFTEQLKAVAAYRTQYGVTAHV